MSDINLRELSDAQLSRTSNTDLQAAMTAAGIGFEASDSKADLLGKIAAFHQANPVQPADNGAQGDGEPGTGNDAGGGASQPWNAPAADAPQASDGLDMEMLGSIADATSANTFVYLGTDATAALVAAGLAEVNPGMSDNFGGVATRATAAGMQRIAEHRAAGSQGGGSVGGEQLPPASAGAQPEQPAASSGPAATVASVGDFVIATVPLPERKSTGAGRSSSYPFDKLEVGQSFFVQATAAKPNPRKSLASTVSSATRRYATKTDQTRNVKVKGVLRAVPIYTENRKFEVYEGTGDHYGKPGVKGAIVARTK